MKEGGWVPDVVVCSNALRTRQTLEAMREEMPELEDADAHFLGSLYTISQLDGQTRAHIETIVETEAQSHHGCVLCLGHNKGWEEAASSFADQQVKLGNCSAAVLSGLGQNWSEAFKSEAEWRLVTVITPH